jgi:hypothetical protein
MRYTIQQGKKKILMGIAVLEISVSDFPYHLAAICTVNKKNFQQPITANKGPLNKERLKPQSVIQAYCV